MKLTTDQNAYLDSLLNSMTGEFSEIDIRPEWTEFLRREFDAGNLGDPVDELAVQSLKRAIDRRGWKFDGAQGALFDGDAILALGDGGHVCMRDANARHLVLHRDVLEENHRRQAAAYAAKRSQIDKWVPALFEQGCTLGDLMGGDTEAVAA